MRPGSRTRHGERTGLRAPEFAASLITLTALVALGLGERFAGTNLDERGLHLLAVIFASAACLVWSGSVRVVGVIADRVGVAALILAEGCSIGLVALILFDAPP